MANEVKIEKGNIVPTRDTLVAFIKGLERELKKDPAALELFKKNPRRFLGDRGLAHDAQRELLQDAGFSKARLRSLISCTITCICTSGCCFTDLDL